MVVGSCGERRRTAVCHRERTGAAETGGAPATGVSVDRGKYLVNITGCHDCHSPKSQGMTPDPGRLAVGPSVHDEDSDEAGR
jgi:hypothetical protein